MEAFIEGLPRSIEGNVTASKPQTLEEAITITQRLMEQDNIHNGRPNGEALRKCILSGTYKPTIVVVQAVAATDDSLAIPEHTTVKTPMNMSPAKKAYSESEKEAIHLILIGIGDEIYSTVDAFQTAHKMWEVIERLQQGKEIAKPITHPFESASEEDSDPEQAQRDKDMQKNLALIAKKTKKVKDFMYHKEKMLLGKQAEKCVPLQAEQYDWLEDTDEEIDEQELEAHYSYMAKILEVPTVDTCIDSEPLEQVQNDTGYNVFANDLQHSEQSKSISNTCIVETNDSNVIPESPDMCDDDIQNDQNDVESDDECVALANLIANLKLNVDENKKFQKQLKKANTTLAQELKECKTILAKTSKTLGESNSVRDKTKVITELKLKKEHDIDKMLSLEKQLKFLKEIVFKRSQSIQIIHMMAPKVPTYNGRPTFADPRYLKQAQSEIPCLYVFPYDQSTHANRLILDEEETLDLERESRSKLNKDSQEMHADLKYVESPEKEIDKLESDKAEFSNMYDMILQECVSNKVWNKQASNVFRKEREQFIEIQDLKAQLQDKNIAISELKKLIEKGKGKYVETKFDKLSVVRQPNAQRIPKPSVLGLSKPVTAQTLPQTARQAIIQLILFIVDSECMKHMMGNLKLLCNFVEKFLGTVRFGNDQFAPIFGYGDLVQGNITINMVYYVKGLNHNLFSVGQFCDADLEVAVWKSTCFVRDLHGNDLLTGNRGYDLYTISLQESTSSTPLCLMAKSLPTQAWLWHR
nr:integrase, catalytic region, zinc finger, CCHC-type, peptidase aspartic, catalytic [Tanacetum cinerariifolium]